MRVLILGSAAGGGFLQWNCNCRVWLVKTSYAAVTLSMALSE